MNAMANVKPKGKKSKKPVTLSAMPTSWDGGATGVANRDRLREEPATEFDPSTGKETPNPNGVRRNSRETWIDKYARKGKLTKQQQAAASNLYAAWAGMPNKDPLAAFLAKVDGKGSDDPLASTIDKRRAFYIMWRQIPIGSRPFIRHVVIEDMSIRSMNGCRDGHTETRYMERLCAGLDAIC
jgi:hypothetical protein